MILLWVTVTATFITTPTATQFLSWVFDLILIVVLCENTVNGLQGYLLRYSRCKQIIIKNRIRTTRQLHNNNAIRVLIHDQLERKKLQITNTKRFDEHLFVEIFVKWTCKLTDVHYLAAMQCSNGLTHWYKVRYLLPGERLSFLRWTHATAMQEIVGPLASLQSIAVPFKNWRAVNLAS